MTAIFLLSASSKMSPLSPSKISPKSSSIVVFDKNSASTGQHDDIFLSIQSPALIKKKGDPVTKGGLTPTSLRLLRSAMTTTQHTTPCSTSYQQRLSSSTTSRRLKRQESEPVSTVCSKERAKFIDSGIVNSAVATPPGAVASTPNSSTDKTMDCHGRRRQIFGSFWDTETSPPDRHSRSNSAVDIPAIPMPAPMIRSKSEGYQYTHNSNSKSHFHPMPWKQLPVSTLPSPLQRLRKSSGGVYPLVQPKSILRHHDDTEPSTVATSAPNVNSVLTDCGRISSSSISSISDTNHSGADADSDVASAASNQRKAMVQFDPRVTVTELAERDHERIWYSDAELSRFKYETVLAARAYLTENPNQIAIYSQATFDPVTKTMRKRALFSMPALADVTITEQDDEEEHGRIPPSCGERETTKGSTPSTDANTTTSSCKLHPQLLLSLLAFDSEDDVICEDLIPSDTTTKANDTDSPLIRHILIVDRNPWILDLFVRSMRAMFDCAEYKKLVKSNIDIQCATTVPVALSIIQQAKQVRHPPFDLIVAEQQPFAQVEQPGSASSDTNENPDNLNWPSLPEASSGVMSSESLSGSELLFRHVSEKEEILLVSVSSSRSASGGSVDTKSNADIVWSKPPPRMDTALRTQLLRALKIKRQHQLGKQIDR
jgi:hypothetical protein